MGLTRSTWVGLNPFDGLGWVGLDPFDGLGWVEKTS